MGISVLDKQGSLLYNETHHLNRKKDIKTGVQYLATYDTIESIFDWISKEILFVSNKDILVAYEKVSRHIGIHAAHMYGAITGILELICERRGVEYTNIHVLTIKKIATGSGKASKTDMINAAIEKWKITPSDDNAADSLWIAEAARVLDEK